MLNGLANARFLIGFTFWVLVHPRKVRQFWRRWVIVPRGQNHFSYQIDLIGLALLRGREVRSVPILVGPTGGRNGYLRDLVSEVCEVVSTRGQVDYRRHLLLARLVARREIQSHRVDWLSDGVTFRSVCRISKSANERVAALGLSERPIVAFYFNENADSQSREENSQTKRREEYWLQSRYEDFSDLVLSDHLASWQQIRGGSWTSHRLPEVWNSRVMDVAAIRLSAEEEVAISARVSIAISDAAGGFWLPAALGAYHLVVNNHKIFTWIGPRGLLVPVLYRYRVDDRVIPYSEALASPVHSPRYRAERGIEAVKVLPDIILNSTLELLKEVELGRQLAPTPAQRRLAQVALEQRHRLRGGYVPRVSNAFLERFPEWIA